MLTLTGIITPVRVHELIPRECFCMFYAQRVILFGMRAVLCSYLRLISRCVFQVYGLIQIVSILEQEAGEGILLQSFQTHNITTTNPAYGSVLQTSGSERERLRIYYFLQLLFLFFPWTLSFSWSR